MALAHPAEQWFIHDVHFQLTAATQLQICLVNPVIYSDIASKKDLRSTMKRRFKTAPPIVPSIVQSAAPNASNRGLIKFQTPPRPETGADRPICSIETQCCTTSYQGFSSNLVNFSNSNVPIAGLMAAQIATLHFKDGLTVPPRCS